MGRIDDERRYSDNHHHNTIPSTNPYTSSQARLGEKPPQVLAIAIINNPITIARFLPIFEQMLPIGVAANRPTTFSAVKMQGAPRSPEKKTDGSMAEQCGLCQAETTPTRQPL
jgi:hypothetical protein